MSEIYKDLDKLYEKIEKIENENKRLHTIIKEVREYITRKDICIDTRLVDEMSKHLDFIDLKTELLEILDKENK